MALPVYVDDHWLVSFVFNRAGRDFTDRDCELLDLLRDGLGALYRSAQLAAAGRGALAGLQDALEAAGSGVARVDARNGLLYATLRGAAHIRRYCGRPPRVGERLPAPLSDWLERVRD